MSSDKVIKDESTSPTIISKNAQATGANRVVLVLYGTETGNAQDLAEMLTDKLRRLHFSVVLSLMDGVPLSSLLSPALVIFVISTTGQGAMPRNARSFWKSLLRKRLPPNCLSKLTYATFGLGDTKYSEYNYAALKLDKRLKQLGATPFISLGQSDEQHPDGIYITFVPWTRQLVAQIQAQFPLPAIVEPIHEDVLLPPLQPLILPHTSSVSTTTRACDPDEIWLDIPDSYAATLCTNKRVTPPSHWQDVRLISFHIPTANLTPAQNRRLQVLLQPGSMLILRPQNDVCDVTKLIAMMDWEAVADTPLMLGQQSSGLTTTATTTRGLFVPAKGAPTLRMLLTLSLDIAGTPRLAFFAKVARFAKDPAHHARLLELADPGFLDDLYNYTTRARRTYVETLEDFPSVRIPVEYVADVFPPLRSRSYSVYDANVDEPSSLSGLTYETIPPLASLVSSPTPTSIPTAAEPAAHSTEASLAIIATVAIALVRYRTVLRRERVGVYSRHVATLPRLPSPAPAAVAMVPVPQTASTLTVSSSVQTATAPAAAATLPAELLRPPLLPLPTSPLVQIQVTGDSWTIPITTRVLAVATGTGVAPLHLLFKQRTLARRKAGTKIGGTGADHGLAMDHSLENPDAAPLDIMFYGCRHPDVDDLTRPRRKGVDQREETGSPDTNPEKKGEKQWDGQETAGAWDEFVGLRVYNAYSRISNKDTTTTASDPSLRRRYVQELIEEHQETVAQMLLGPGAVQVVICGSAGKMPQAVRAALVQAMVMGAPRILAKQLSPEEAAARLTGRVLEETW